MEILTGEQMRRVDRRAIDEFGVPSLDLMEAAGRGVAAALLEEFPEARQAGVLILCGKGNNGGDGLVAARHLAALGLEPRVVLLADGDGLSGDAATNLAAARAAGIEVHETPDETRWQAERSSLDSGRIVLDAMLGTGVRGGARGLVARVIEDLNRVAPRVAAVDLPSGVDGDRPHTDGCAVTAQRTFTLCRPKVALVLGDDSVRAGRLRVIPIGIPAAALRAEPVDLEWIDADLARSLLPARPSDSHKGTYGHLLAVAGSAGKSGAAVLLARASLRCGVGLVTVATPVSAQGAVAVQQAEVMTEPLAETDDGVLAGGGADPALSLLATRDALALGPGLGSAGATCAAVESIVAGAERPSVIDADGLNAFAGNLAGLAARPAPTVLTPHPGEAARLLDIGNDEVQADRLAAVRRIARETSAVVVLKGHRTLIARPDGRVSVNSTGNAGMATAGTGDALTGAIGAFLARGLDGWDAARLGVYVHGDAGDRARRQLGQESMIASDLIANLPAPSRRWRRAAETEPDMVDTDRTRLRRRDGSTRPIPRTVYSLSEQETIDFGRSLARLLEGGELILLEGDLGLGKTVFARGVAAGLEIPPEDVSSPSYSLINEYRGGRLPLYHVDLYRLDDPAEIATLGLDDLLASGAVVITEWGDRLPPYMRRDAIVVKIHDIGEDSRQIELVPAPSTQKRPSSDA